MKPSKYTFIASDKTRVRVYLHGVDVADKWTAVLRSPDWDRSAIANYVPYRAMLCMSDHPTHPQGFSMFSNGYEGKHLGIKQEWLKVPQAIRDHIISRIT
jgi:hypothetical protein